MLRKQPAVPSTLPQKERKKENSSLCWRFSGMLDHNLAIVVTEIPLETRKRESQTPLPPPTRVPGCFSSTRSGQSALGIHFQGRAWGCCLGVKIYAYVKEWTLISLWGWNYFCFLSDLAFYKWMRSQFNTWLFNKLGWLYLDFEACLIGEALKKVLFLP